MTSSSLLKNAKKIDDSLAGRRFYRRLHSSTPKELVTSMQPQQVMPRIMKEGGLLEPFYSTDPDFIHDWPART